jgi:hypothetical protein
VSVNISHSVFSVLFSRDDMAMQASVVCVSCYEFTFSSSAVQYNIQQCFIIYFLLYFVLSDVAVELLQSGNKKQ